ncbi:DUF262 domain-containing protein [Pseudoalteromonas sp. SR44-2]|uniref:DUF262 domain-containing protein n=1 Tax=Pseudoalteromonas sp. SR44-2 TaxID=2760937 RepID=UPI001601807C|nr:DUF262 domain-containing protein [Pseudoalteromonas sp. SR44-2]MBB1338851.1 DUF262 domain-containing protein [Pseudoalteromonas sp. SR44-2]
MNPVYASVYSLFEYKPCYFIPKYQRAYAWKEEQVNDFTKDIKSSFNKRYQGRPKQHFFGGVISVMSQYPRTNNVSQFEVIDGQQRLSTFNLLVNIILSKYKDLDTKAKEAENNELSERCCTQINDLTPRFVEFNQLIGEDTTVVKTFKMSRRDDDYYSGLIRGRNPVISRDSHQRLKFAYDEITKTVSDLIESDSLDEIFTRLSVLESVLAADFKILHLVTTQRNDAYQLFQVINDRGTSLTDADLLRCKILEFMEGNNEQQDEAETILDEIVSHSKTEDHLGWAFEAKLGLRPKSGALFDEFMESYFELQGLEEINITQLQELLNRTRALGESISLIRNLILCEWPFERQLPVEAWDRDRLQVLIEYMGNTAALPLLVTANKLSQTQFSEIVSMLERFFFRFKMMCNGHNSLLKAIYIKHSSLILNDPESYNVNQLREDLNTLIANKASEDIFGIAIEELLYSPKGNKKKLKHMLIMLSQFGRWYDNGAQGNPTCLDKSVIIDRKEGCTLEHIYPKGLDSEAPNFDIDLEPLKNTIFNLCLLSSIDNRIVDTSPFEEKKQVFLNSSLYITRKVGGYDEWNLDSLNDFKAYIKEAAFKIFVA